MKWQRFTLSGCKHQGILEHFKLWQKLSLIGLVEYKNNTYGKFKISKSEIVHCTSLTFLFSLNPPPSPKINMLCFKLKSEPWIFFILNNDNDNNNSYTNLNCCKEFYCLFLIWKRKELSFCQKLKSSHPNIFAIWWCKLLIFRT